MTLAPTLTTDRLILRAPQFSDLDLWTRFMASDRARFIGGPQPDAGQAWRAFAHMAGMWALRGVGSFVFARKDTPDQPLGSCGPWHPIGWPERELGWTVWDPSVEGTGLAFEAATEARRYAYEVLGWQRPVSYIYHTNTRSIALAERMGCVRDDTAAKPFPEKPDLVYRHPEAIA